jgi:hypothetical protein
MKEEEGDTDRRDDVVNTTKRDTGRREGAVTTVKRDTGRREEDKKSRAVRSKQSREEINCNSIGVIFSAM